MTPQDKVTIKKLATGVPGLDEILGGGFPKGRLFLIEGDPGAGKTTLGLQFLLQGVKRKEMCLYIPLSETRAAHERLERGEQLGKIVLSIPG